MTVDYEHLAQRSAEERLAVATAVLFDDEDQLASVELAAPYCGCDTCVVREVISAAWPYLYRLAHEPDVDVPDLP